MSEGDYFSTLSLTIKVLPGNPMPTSVHPFFHCYRGRKYLLPTSVVVGVGDGHQKITKNEYRFHKSIKFIGVLPALGVNDCPLFAARL